MLRKLRVEYAGAIYHVMSRRNRTLPNPTGCNFAKGTPKKLRSPKRPPQETSASLTWLAKKLNLGTAGSLANLPRREDEN
jgi:hypothetical protein